MPLDRDIDIPDVLRPGFPSSANARLSLGLGLGPLDVSPTLHNQPTTTIRLISNANFDCGAGKNGIHQLDHLKTTSVFDDDLKAGKPAGESKLLVRFISMLILVMAQTKMKHLNCSL
jgi:hypothetical protein